MKNDVLKFFSDYEIFSKNYLNCYLSNILTTDFFIFGLARLTRICNPSPDSETLLKIMRYWKFSQKKKTKTKLFNNTEKEVGNFSKTGTTVQLR